MCDEDKIRKVVKQEIAVLDTKLTNLVQTTTEIKDNVKKINGRLGKVEDKAHELDKKVDHRREDCPHTSTIEKLDQARVAEDMLKEYIEEQRKKAKEAREEDASIKSEVSRKQQKRIEIIIGTGLLIIAVITFVINLIV